MTKLILELCPRMAIWFAQFPKVWYYLNYCSTDYQMGKDYLKKCRLYWQESFPVKFFSWIASIFRHNWDSCHCDTAKILYNGYFFSLLSLRSSIKGASFSLISPLRPFYPSLGKIGKFSRSRGGRTEEARRRSENCTTKFWSSRRTRIA